RLHRGLDAVERGMGHVNEHPEPVHVANHVAPEGGEATVAWRFRLDVPQLVHPIVDELDRANATRVRLLDAIEPPFEEVAALHGQDRRRPRLVPRPLEVRHALDERELPARDAAPPGLELRVRGLVQLTRLRLALGVDLSLRARPGPVNYWWACVVGPLAGVAALTFAERLCSLHRACRGGRRTACTRSSTQHPKRSRTPWRCSTSIATRRRCSRVARAWCRS